MGMTDVTDDPSIAISPDSERIPMINAIACQAHPVQIYGIWIFVSRCLPDVVLGKFVGGAIQRLQLQHEKRS